MKRTIELFLTNASNDYQQLLKSDAEAAAVRHGIDLRVVFADGNPTQQIRQIYSCIHSRSEDRPSAMLIHPFQDGALNRVVRDAAHAGVGCVLLNRTPEILDGLRREYPDTPIAGVGPDQVEIGRIQARQFRALLQQRGLVLYVQGVPSASSTQERSQGTREGLVGSQIELAVVNGDFRTDRGEEAVAGWLRVVLPGGVRPALIGCQNDGMAVGARKALEALAAELNRPELRAIPITGCDGLRDFGQRLVREGQLVATIIVPPTAGAAIEILARFFERGELPPAKVLLPVTPFPPLALS